MPVMKTQEIQCLECKDVLLAVMGERKTLVCSCEAVKVNVHSNYISTESNSDNYELGEIQEIDSSYIPLLPNPSDRPLNEEMMSRVSWLLVETKKKVRDLEWEIQRLIDLVEELR
tara:strand:- start:262 stop:606 length:345 start_codon:yes stop_codon:yes gene_type:complete